MKCKIQMFQDLACVGGVIFKTSSVGTIGCENARPVVMEASTRIGLSGRDKFGAAKLT